MASLLALLYVSCAMMWAWLGLTVVRSVPDSAGPVISVFGVVFGVLVGPCVTGVLGWMCYLAFMNRFLFFHNRFRYCPVWETHPRVVRFPEHADCCLVPEVALVAELGLPA